MTGPFDTDDMGPDPMGWNDIPEDAVLGTREHPFAASQETAANFMKMVKCFSHTQRVAQIRVAAGLFVDWDTWTILLKRIRGWAPAGWYQWEVESDEDDEPRLQRGRWHEATAENFLLGGKGAPFKRRADIPPKVYALVAKTIEDAKDLSPNPHSGTAIARMLGVTAAFRREHKLWALGAMDATKEELRAQSRRLSAARRSANADRLAAKRREAGRMERSEYEDAAALRREACALAGISDRTFKRRSEAEKAAMLDAARAAREPAYCSVGPSVTGQTAYIEDSCASRSHLGQTTPSMVAGAPTQSGARPPAQHASSGKASGRNRAAVGGNMQPAGRKRTAHPINPCAARPSAATGRADGLAALTATLARLREPPARLSRALDCLHAYTSLTEKVRLIVSLQQTSRLTGANHVGR